MEIKTLNQLIVPDERVLRFTPMGFSTSLIMTPEGALNHQQGTIAQSDLLPQAPDAVRERFERLRLLHVYGFFQYEFFTMVEEASYFVVEVALRQRFLEAYKGRIPWRSKQGAVGTVEVSSYEGVLERLKQHRAAPRVERPWQLVSLDGSGADPEFNGSLRSLFKWARAEGLLYGQRTYIRDHALLELRNRTAHPERGKLITPVDSTFAIRDLAELVNQLWGDPPEQAYPKP